MTDRPSFVLAIDPGPTESAGVVFDGQRPISKWKCDNNQMLDMIESFRGDAWEHKRVVIEMIASYGMPVGAEVFDTCVWIGRFKQAALERGFAPVDLIVRAEVKKHLCGATAGVNDAVIRQRLIDIFGPGRDLAIGKKASPGPLYEFSKDMWAALAVAVVWWEKNAGPVTFE